jgi:hypothetical protein
MPVQTTRRRRVMMWRVTMLCATVALATLGVLAAPLHAADSPSTIAPAAPGSLDPDEVLNGITVGPAVVTAPGTPRRNLDATQAAAFMRTWLPDSIFQHLANVRPPRCLPIAQLHMSTTWSGTSVPIVVYYASDGDTAWVGMPPQSLGWASVDSEKWILAPNPAATIAAFGGPNAGPTTTAACPTTGSNTASSKQSSSSGISWAWIATPLVAIVVGAGVWLVARRRGPGRATVA